MGTVIPYEIVWEINFFLDLKTIASCIRTSKEYSDILKKDMFWKILKEKNSEFRIFLDLINCDGTNGKRNNDWVFGERIFKMTFDFQSNDPEELQVKKNEIVTPVKKWQGWLLAENRQGKIGYVPENYGKYITTYKDPQLIKRKYELILENHFQVTKQKHMRSIQFIVTCKLFKSKKFQAFKKIGLFNRRIKMLKSRKRTMNFCTLSTKEIMHFISFLGNKELRNLCCTSSKYHQEYKEILKCRKSTKCI